MEAILVSHKNQSSLTFNIFIIVFLIHLPKYFEYLFQIMLYLILHIIMQFVARGLELLPRDPNTNSSSRVFSHVLETSFSNQNFEFFKEFMINKKPLP